jgi:hypothetical protein
VTDIAGTQLAADTNFAGAHGVAPGIIETVGAGVACGIDHRGIGQAVALGAMARPGGGPGGDIRRQVEFTTHRAKGVTLIRI